MLLALQCSILSYGLFSEGKQIAVNEEDYYDDEEGEEGGNYDGED